MSEDLLGKTGEPFTMPVELGKIREFARATKSRSPAYQGAPGDQPVSPATFLMTCEWWLKPENRALHGVKRDLARILHGEQEFQFHGPPPRAGDVLTCVERVDKAYSKPGKRGGTMSFLEVVTEFRNPAGQLVATMRNVTIETTKSTQEG